MKYQNLGKTNLNVSRICFGSLTLGPLCANLSIEEGSNLLLAAFDMGINFIDTAEQYINYPYITEALTKTDKEIVIATKTYATDDINAANAVEDARIVFKRDTLDIFLLHEIRSLKDFDSRDEAWQVLKTAKSNGVIKAIGISTHSAEVATWAASQEEIDIIHPMLNIAGIGIIDGSLKDMLRAIDTAHKNGKGIYGMKAIGGGALMHQARTALEWAFRQENLDSVAIGFKDHAELMTNIGWMNGEDPTEAKQVKLLDRNIVFDKDPACHGCGKCIEKCALGALTFDSDGCISWNKDKCVYCCYCIGACRWFCLSFC